MPITNFSVRDRFWRLRYALWLCLYTRCSLPWCWRCACDVPSDMMDESPRDTVREDLSAMADC